MSLCHQSNSITKTPFLLFQLLSPSSEKTIGYNRVARAAITIQKSLTNQLVCIAVLEVVYVYSSSYSMCVKYYSEDEKRIEGNDQSRVRRIGPPFSHDRAHTVNVLGPPLNPLVLPSSVCVCVCVCVWCSKSQVTVKWQHNNNSLHSPNGDTEKGFRHSSQRVGRID